MPMATLEQQSTIPLDCIKYPELQENDDEQYSLDNIIEADLATIRHHIKFALAQGKPVSVSKLVKTIALELGSQADVELIRFLIGDVIRNSTQLGLCFIVKRKYGTYIVTPSTATQQEKETLPECQKAAIDRVRDNCEQSKLDNAESLLAEACRVIDARHGDGHAAKHQGLVLAYMMMALAPVGS